MSSNDFPRVVKLDPIPESIIVAACPLHGGKKIRALKCGDCKYFDGFLQTQESGLFMKDYRVLCCHAVPRQLEELAED